MNVTGPAVVSREVSSVRFSVYSDDEIRKLSVKQITNPILFDNLNHPDRGGLYDPALGPLDRNAAYADPFRPVPQCLLTNVLAVVRRALFRTRRAPATPATLSLRSPCTTRTCL